MLLTFPNDVSWGCLFMIHCVWVWLCQGHCSRKDPTMLCTYRWTRPSHTSAHKSASCKREFLTATRKCSQSFRAGLWTCRLSARQRTGMQRKSIGFHENVPIAQPVRDTEIAIAQWHQWRCSMWLSFPLLEYPPPQWVKSFRVIEADVEKDDAVFRVRCVECAPLTNNAWDHHAENYSRWHAGRLWRAMISITDAIQLRGWMSICWTGWRSFQPGWH